MQCKPRLKPSSSPVYLAGLKPGTSTAILLLVLALGLSASVWAAGKKKSHDKKTAAAQMDERQRAQHVLNRLSFGPRPGDADRVAAMGVDKWFEQQLHPERIDDSALDRRLQPLRTLRMNARELVEDFPPPQVIKQVASGRMAMPSDKTERAVERPEIPQMMKWFIKLQVARLIGNDP